MAPIPNALQAGPSSMLSRQSPPTITNANASTVSDAASVSGSPLPSRLTRSDVANFLPFVQDLDVLEQTDLSARLARRPTIHPGAHFIGGRHRTGIGPGSRNQAADEQEEDLADSAVDDEDEDGDARMIAGPSRARRVDGPNFAPTYQNTTTSNRLSTAKKRKRTGASTINGGRRGWKGTRRGRGGSSTSSPWDEREMVRWPVMASELHVEVSDETLEESIQSFASRFIRINNMTLVRKAWDEADGNERNQKDDNEEDDLDPVLPEALVSSTVEMVNRVLVGLAACRPADIGRRRKQMEIIDWMGVLDVAGMIPSEVEAVRKANRRLRALYQSEEHDYDRDLLSHRLGILYPKYEEDEAISTSTAPKRNSNTILDELYAPVIPKKDTAIRLHQSKEEQKRRAEKRRLKEQKRKLRGQ